MHAEIDVSPAAQQYRRHRPHPSWKRRLRASLGAAALVGALTMPWSVHATSSYLAIWASDKEKQDSAANTDFLAIVDADPRSSTYGKVVNTASLQRVPGKNLLNDLGFTEALGLTAKYNLPKSGLPSNVLNEAHHMTHEPIAVGRHRYLYLGGLISANVFRCDVADPLEIPDCPLVTAASDVKNFSGIDDFAQPAERQSARQLHGCRRISPLRAGWSSCAWMAPSSANITPPAGRAGPLHAERQRRDRYRPARASARHRDPPGPGPGRHGRLRRSAQPRDRALGRQRHPGPGHHGAVLEAVQSQGRPHRDLAAARRARAARAWPPTTHPKGSCP